MVVENIISRFPNSATNQSPKENQRKSAQSAATHLLSNLRPLLETFFGNTLHDLEDKIRMDLTCGSPWISNLTFFKKIVQESCIM